MEPSKQAQPGPGSTAASRRYDQGGCPVDSAEPVGLPGGVSDIAGHGGDEHSCQGSESAGRLGEKGFVKTGSDGQCECGSHSASGAWVAGSFVKSTGVDVELGVSSEALRVRF